jgi:sterol desaturase/sphingolipid hydroxylase (fatty acid hydroxylase superfamily)
MPADSVVGMLGLFALIAVGSIALERAAPARRSQPLFVRARRTDWLYWPFSAFVTGNLTRALVFGMLGGFALARGYRGPLDDGLFAWLFAAPAWGLGRLAGPLQFLAVLVIGDLVNYWNHRARHAPWFWSFHAVHHSPTHLDWLAAVRMHPVDDVADNVAVACVVLALGATPAVWLATGPFLLFFNAWLHANVDLRLGPLRYLVATPAFHRWHHVDDIGAPSCNFAGIFPIWDLAFGTFYLPEGLPARVGPGPLGVPATLTGQLAFPFRSATGTGGH